MVEVHGILRSRVHRMGTWSVQGGRRLGAVSQRVKALREWAVQKTLSSLVQLPLLVDCKVGLLWGSTILMSWSTNSSMMCCAAS